METTEVITEVKANNLPSASAGGDNAYYIPRCEIVERSPAYASCLWKISEHAAGRMKNYPTYAECDEPIRSGRCKALGMKQDEELKGVALYYFPRQYINNQIITSQTPADQIPKRTQFKNRLPDSVHRIAKPAAPVAPITAGSDYADAINAAMSALPAAPIVPAVVPVTAIRLAMLPGESPMQYARRRAEENNQPKEAA